METEETKQIKIALTKHSKSLIRHGVQEDGLARSHQLRMVTVVAQQS